MKYLERFEAELGPLLDYLAIGVGSLLLVLGIFLLTFNRRFFSLVAIISTIFFCSAITFGTGCLLHFNMVADKDPIAPLLFFGIVGVSLASGFGSGIMVAFIPPLQYLKPFMIGLAGGFSVLNMFSTAVHSEAVLLVCSILLGLIIGWMSHVFQEPLQIVVLPCTGVLMVELGTMGIIEGVMLLVNMNLTKASNISYILSRVWLGLGPVITLINGYYHYRVYYLRREKFELVGGRRHTSEDELKAAAPSSQKRKPPPKPQEDA